MSSENLRLLILYPWTDIPVPLSLTESITLSRYEINIFADIGSPCLVPTVVLNQSPNVVLKQSPIANLHRRLQDFTDVLQYLDQSCSDSIWLECCPSNVLFDGVECLLEIDETVDDVSSFTFRLLCHKPKNQDLMCRASVFPESGLLFWQMWFHLRFQSLQYHHHQYLTHVA